MKYEKKKPSYKQLKVWGCLAKLLIPTPKKVKIGLKTVDCIFIGYLPHNTAYWFLVHDSKIPKIQKNTILESRNVSFFETTFSHINENVESDQDENVGGCEKEQKTTIREIL